MLGHLFQETLNSPQQRVVEGGLGRDRLLTPVLQGLQKGLVQRQRALDAGSPKQRVLPSGPPSSQQNISETSCHFQPLNYKVVLPRKKALPRTCAF